MSKEKALINKKSTWQNAFWSDCKCVEAFGDVLEWRYYVEGEIGYKKSNDFLYGKETLV